jgi:hypothetical protein
VPPDPTRPSDLKAVKQLYLQAENTESEPVELPEEAEALRDRLLALKQQSKAADAEAELVEAKLRAALGEATHGKTPSGDILIARPTSVPGRTQIVKPYRYRKLIWHLAKPEKKEE